MDAESIKVEIERLNAVLALKSVLKSRDVGLVDQEVYEAMNEIYLQQIARRNRLIIELCDALEQVSWRAEDRANLIKRAREVTR